MDTEGSGSKTWILVKDGKFVKNHKIDVTSLAKILTDVQRAYDNIGHSKYGSDYNKEDFRLYIGNIEQGSVALPVAPLTYAPRIIEEPDPFKNVTKCFEGLISIVRTEPDKFKTQLEDEVTDPSNRIGLLKSMYSLSGNDSQVYLKNSVSKPDSGYSLDKNDSELINKLIEGYTATGEWKTHGLMLGFQAEKKFFTIKTDNGRNVRCSFDAKDAEYYHSFFWKWVSVTGILKTTQKTYKLISVSEITEHNTHTLDKIGEYKLNKSLEFQTSYDKDDGLWGLVNEDLSLYGYGIDYLKTINSLEEEIEGHVISFTEYPDERHTQKSIELKKRLQEYINFEDIREKINEKYGDN